MKHKVICLIGFTAAAIYTYEDIELRRIFPGEFPQDTIRRSGSLDAEHLGRYAEMKHYFKYPKTRLNSHFEELACYEENGKKGCKGPGVSEVKDIVAPGKSYPSLQSYDTRKITLHPRIMFNINNEFTTVAESNIRRRFSIRPKMPFNLNHRHTSEEVKSSRKMLDINNRQPEVKDADESGINKEENVPPGLLELGRKLYTYTQSMQSDTLELINSEFVKTVEGFKPDIIDLGGGGMYKKIERINPQAETDKKVKQLNSEVNLMNKNEISINSEPQLIPNAKVAIETTSNQIGQPDEKQMSGEWIFVPKKFRNDMKNMIENEENDQSQKLLHQALGQYDIPGIQVISEQDLADLGIHNVNDLAEEYENLNKTSPNVEEDLAEDENAEEESQPSDAKNEEPDPEEQEE